MDRLLVAALATTLLGLAVLLVLAYAVAPPPQPIGALAEREGQRVCVEGVLAHHRATPGGPVRFAVTDGEDTIQGLSPGPWAAVPGDRVRACGPLQREGANLLLRPERPDDLTVLAAFDAELLPLSDLAARPWDHRDQHVTVQGLLVEEGRRHYLADAAASARIRAIAPPDAPDGTSVRVTGVVEYDMDESLFRLRIDSLTTVGRAPA